MARMDEMDWRTYDSARDKAEKLSNQKGISKYEAERRTNQANAFEKHSREMCDKQYGIDKIKKRESDHNTEVALGTTNAPFKHTNGELKRLDRQSRDVKDYYDGNQEYKNGKWLNKESKDINMTNKKIFRMTESELRGMVAESVKKILSEAFKQAPWDEYDPIEDRDEMDIMNKNIPHSQEEGNDGKEQTFQNNQDYSHFAVNKATNKIVNGWDYKDYDPDELRQFKNDYFTRDLIDYDLDPKQYKIVTAKYLIRQGIDPNDNNNWANN